MNYRSSDVVKFWKNVTVVGKNECWEWRGCLSGNGYGRFSIWGEIKKVYRAHRLSYYMFWGVDPEECGLCVCHHCDNPLCVNPHHLFLGTPYDNYHDMRRKGRAVLPPRRPKTKTLNKKINQKHKRATPKPPRVKVGVRKGEKHPNARLSREEVIRIKQLLLDESVNQSEIGRMFGVSCKTINHIATGYRWGHVEI